MIQDHLKRIVLSHYEEGEAPVKCVSKKKTLENFIDEKQFGINKRSNKKYFIIKCI